MLQGKGAAQPDWDTALLPLRVPVTHTDKCHVFAACVRGMKDNMEIMK